MRRRYNFYLISMLIVLLEGCGRAQMMPISINTTTHLNPDDDGISKPVVITLYQLTRPMPFKSLQYNQLTHSAPLSLGATLVDYKTMEIRPNSKQTINIPLYKATKVLGLSAGFHHINNADWQSIVVLPNSFHKIRLSINLGINRIDSSISKDKL